MWREREKGESLRIVIEKLSRIHIGLGYIYIHASGTHNTVRKEKEKGKVNNLNNYTLSNTPPQAGAYMLYAPSLLQMYLI